MEMTTKKIFGTRFLAVAIFFGMGASQALAHQTENVYVNGKPVIELNFFDGGEFSSETNFNANLIDASKLGADYWKNILGLRNVTPWQIALVTSTRRTVDGTTFSFDAAQFTSENYIAQMLQGDRTLELFDMETLADTNISASEVQSVLEKNSPSGDAALSYVTIGRNLGAKRDDAINGWFVDATTILPTNEQAADFVGALRLELARSLGVQVLLDGSNFAEKISDPNAWTLHLVDSNGNYASEGKRIVTSEELGDRDASDFFVADKKIYFVGDNVSEVLNGATFDGVSGIPINAWGGEDFDGVWTLIPGLMTALPYKNYSTFTELELAALQDIGYNIDRKKFYGLSIYKSGTTVNNTKNFASGEDLAIGLHVFGANNSIRQSGDISLTGTGAVGIRVDGKQNNLTIPADTRISSSGERGKGLLVSYGRDHNLNVSGEIFATGDDGNAVEFNFGSNALGAGGEYRGSYLRYLRYVDTLGNIVSAQNLPLTMTDGFNYSANELNGALINDFNLSGTLRGAKNAIYIGKNAFVKNINVNEGAQIFGDITSDWKNFTAEDGFTTVPIEIQYDGESYDASKYIPDLATNLNFNADLTYDGNINGANNIKMHVNEGTLNFSGTADILNVEVMSGAKLFGGTFTLNDMRFDIANGFTDSTTGKFINHGTIGAGSPNTNLIINGDLISDGFLQKISGGTNGMIIVNGNANIDGSTITTDSLLPNETETVLIANSITGNIANPVGSPVKLSALLRATGAIVGNTVTVTTYEETTSLPELNPEESETLDAMNNMFDNLSGDSQQSEMTTFFNLDEPETVQTLHDISSNDSAQIMSVAQQNTAVDHMISDRITKVFAPDFVDMPPDFVDIPHDYPDFNGDYVDVNIRPNNLAEGDSDAPPVKVKVPVPRKRRENNFWLNYMKNWGSLNGGGTDYHGSVIVGGYDRPFGSHVRAGLFATYGTIGYSAQSSRATVYDTRIGLYAGYHNKQSDVYLYVNGGQLRNSLHRGLSALGLSTNANYKSHIVEIGGEYKYDLTPKKTWHVSPYVNFQSSYLRQDGYHEHGAGIYNQHVESNSNTYFAAQAGLDFKRYYKRGVFGFRFGVKHGFTGVDPDLTIRYEGDGSNSYRLRNDRDKTHFVFSLRGENEFARGWSVGGETEFQISKNDRDVTASIMLRRIW